MFASFGRSCSLDGKPPLCLLVARVNRLSHAVFHEPANPHNYGCMPHEKLLLFLQHTKRPDYKRKVVDNHNNDDTKPMRYEIMFSQFQKRESRHREDTIRRGGCPLSTEPDWSRLSLMNGTIRIILVYRKHSNVRTATTTNTATSDQPASLIFTPSTLSLLIICSYIE